MTQVNGRIAFVAILVAASATIARAGPAGHFRADDELQRCLSQSEFCVSGRFAAVLAVSDEQGVNNYLCDVQVLEMIKGKLSESTIRVSFTRVETDGNDALPWVKPGAKVLLFLNGPVGNACSFTGASVPSYSLASPSFGSQPYADDLVAALKRIAETPEPQPQVVSSLSVASSELVDIEGRWLLTMPKGFEFEAQLERLDGGGRYRFVSDAANLRGIYAFCDLRLTMSEPENERLTGLVWQVVNKNVLMLTVHPEKSQVGSDYRNATLSRLRHPCDALELEKAPVLSLRER